MLIILMISIIIYIISGLVIYHNIRYLEKEQKIKFILGGMIVITLFTIIICAITTAKIDIQNKQVIGITRITEILIFSPINSTIWLPYIGSTLSKYKAKEIDDKKLSKRAIIAILIIVITVIIETSYIDNFQTQLLRLN